MHKVVVERPRWNPGPGKNDRRAQLPDELQPKFEGIRRPYRWRKNFTDLLGPLRRWLQSQLGRPWNDVYSEACAVIKMDSVVRAHIRTHLLEFVERDTFMQDGEVCALVNSWNKGGILPVRKIWSRWRQFYVHPETGRLEKIPRPAKQKSYWEKIRDQETLFWQGNGYALKQIKGSWFGCYFQIVPDRGLFTGYDHLAGQVVGRGGLQWRHGQYWQCVRKQQLSRRELRRYGLKNTAQATAERSRSSILSCGGPAGLGTFCDRATAFIHTNQNPQPWRSYATPHPAI